MSETAKILVELAAFLMLAGGLAFTVYELPRCHDTKPAMPRPPEPVSTHRPAVAPNKGAFDRLTLERLARSPGEAESQREYWTLCDVFQALDNMRCRPPQWLLPKLEEVQRRPPEDRAEGYRALRSQLLAHLAQHQKETGWM